MKKLLIIICLIVNTLGLYFSIEDNYNLLVIILNGLGLYISATIIAIDMAKSLNK